jgi:hypothetical protein
MELLSFLQSLILPYIHGSMIRSILLPLPESCDGIVVILTKFNPALYSWFHDQVSGEFSYPFQRVVMELLSFLQSLILPYIHGSMIRFQEYSPPLSSDGIFVILTKFNPALYLWFHDQENSPPPSREL